MQSSTKNALASVTLTWTLIFGVMPQGLAAQDGIVTAETLLDRLQIEDIVIGYYSDLTSEGRRDIAQHYTPDATFDVNGVVFTGHREIQGLYPAEDSMGAPEGGRFQMLLNNPLIRVHGDRASADLIFTGVISDTLEGAPRLFEQGSDRMEFVRVDGRWLIQRRILTSYAGLPPGFATGLEQIRRLQGDAGGSQ